MVQVDDLEQRTSAIYQKIEQLKSKQGLLLKQVTRTETRYAINLIDSDSKAKIEKVQNAALSVRVKFLERVKQRQLQSLPERLLFEVAIYRKRETPDTNQLLSMKERWKALGDQCKRLLEEIKTNGLQLSEDAAATFETVLPGQLFCLENNLKAIEEFRKESIVKLVELINLPLPAEPADWEARKVEIEEYVLLLDPKLQSQIDAFVCLYSESTEGNEWGKTHRYDSKKVFKKAFGCALWEHIKSMLQNANWNRPITTAAYPSLINQFYKFATEKQPKSAKKPMDRSRVLATLSKPASSPTSEQSGTTVITEVVKENAVQELFRKNQLPPTLTGLDIPELSNDGPKNAEQYAKLKAKLRSKKLLRALYIEAGQDTFQKILYGQKRPHIYHAGSGYTIRIKEKSELDKIQSKLETACQLGGIELAAQYDFIRGCLNSLPLPQRYKVEEFVYHLSKDPQKGGPNWGQRHAYDNPQVLLDAIKMTKEALAQNIG